MPLAYFRAVVTASRDRRFTFASETATQADIAAAVLPAIRERRLGEFGIVDLFCDGAAIEEKRVGPKRAIHRLCVRYRRHLAQRADA